jgi:hypothetical protein
VARTPRRCSTGLHGPARAWSKLPGRAPRVSAARQSSLTPTTACDPNALEVEPAASFGLRQSTPILRPWMKVLREAERELDAATRRTALNVATL